MRQSKTEEEGSFVPMSDFAVSYLSLKSLLLWRSNSVIGKNRQMSIKVAQK